MTSRGSHLAGNATAPADATARQEVRFCRSRDGVRIAYAVHGQGPPLVIDSCWLSHLQYDWQSPVWRHFLEDLGAICRATSGARRAAAGCESARCRRNRPDQETFICRSCGVVAHADHNAALNIASRGAESWGAVHRPHAA